MQQLDTATITVTEAFTKPRADVWRGLTEEVQKWWPKDFYIGTYDGTVPLGIRLDARVGGQFIEDWGGGDGLLWGSVIVCKKEHYLILAGDSTKDWGGPNRTFIEYRLADAEAGGGTSLTFKVEAWGVVSEATAKSLQEGWEALMQAVHGWVEKGEQPERPASIVD